MGSPYATTAGGPPPMPSIADSPKAPTSTQDDRPSAASSPTGVSASVADKPLTDPIPEVIRDAKVGGPPPGSKGYHPAVALSLATGHRWTTYGTFMSALRNLMLVDVRDSSSLSSAWRSLSSLTDHRGPFAADRRFPDDEIYVCVDRAPLSLVLLRLARELGTAGKDGYYVAVEEAIRAVMSEEAGAPKVLFSRSTFESNFQLQWI